MGRFRGPFLAVFQTAYRDWSSFGSSSSFLATSSIVSSVTLLETSLRVFLAGLHVSLFLLAACCL